MFHSEECGEQASITRLPVLGCSAPELRDVFLTFKFGVPQTDRFWTEWQWKLVHSPYQPPPVPNLHKSPRAYHEFSTFIRWLCYVDIAWFVGLVNNSGIPEDHKSPRYQSKCLLGTVTGKGSIPHRSLRSYLATLSLDTDEGVKVGDVSELEEDVGCSTSFLESVMDFEESKLDEELVDNFFYP